MTPARLREMANLAFFESDDAEVRDALRAYATLLESKIPSSKPDCERLRLLADYVENLGDKPWLAEIAAYLREFAGRVPSEARGLLPDESIVWHCPCGFVNLDSQDPICCGCEKKRPHAAPPRGGDLCPHGFVLADNICGPCSQGRPNRASPEPSPRQTMAYAAQSLVNNAMNKRDHFTHCDKTMGGSHLCTCGMHEYRELLNQLDKQPPTKAAPVEPTELMRYAVAAGDAIVEASGKCPHCGALGQKGWAIIHRIKTDPPNHDWKLHDADDREAESRAEAAQLAQVNRDMDFEVVPMTWQPLTKSESP